MLAEFGAGIIANRSDAMSTDAPSPNHRPTTRLARLVELARSADPKPKPPKSRHDCNAPMVAVALLTAAASPHRDSTRQYSTTEIAAAFGYKSHTTVVDVLRPERLAEHLDNYRVNLCMRAVRSLLRAEGAQFPDEPWPPKYVLEAVRAVTGVEPRTFSDWAAISRHDIPRIVAHARELRTAHLTRETP
jgi:hypothetical protein